ITRTKNVSFNRTRNVNLHTILPKFISDTLIYSIPKMVKVFKNLDFKEVTLYGAETRSSSPVRIKRGEDGQSVNTKGLYPCGEGAGYAGGIVSSALDGLKIAKFIIEQ
ncbi:MAG: hypothetical protein KAR38_11840, partial [Calditrichia bacterium]|nr:hypothetical protein [Calditrichia bacterium]